MKFLFNTTIMPNEGMFQNQKMNPKTGKSTLAAWVDANEKITSALGHQGSADAFNAIHPPLQAEVNRSPATMDVGDQAIALKVNGRLPEGAILTHEALESAGYDLYLITRVQ